MIVNVFKGSVPRREVWRKEARLNIFTRKLFNAKKEKAYRLYGMLMMSGRWIQKGTPTVEEYAALHRISLSNPNKIFWKKSKKIPFRRKLAQMMNISANNLDSKTKQNGRNEYVQCDFLKEFISENNDGDRVVDMFALVVYRTIIFQ